MLYSMSGFNIVNKVKVYIIYPLWVYENIPTGNICITALGKNFKSYFFCKHIISM